jgi:hypothetical protein
MKGMQPQRFIIFPNFLIGFIARALKLESPCTLVYIFRQLLYLQEVKFFTWPRRRRGTSTKTVDLTFYQDVLIRPF